MGDVALAVLSDQRHGNALDSQCGVALTRGRKDIPQRPLGSRIGGHQPPTNGTQDIACGKNGAAGGIGVNEALTVQWPTELHVLMAFLQPDVLVERLMAEIDQIANTPCPRPERERRIAELEEEIDRLQRTEEAIVVATGAPREAGCPPWVVLGVKAIEAPGVRPA